MFVENLNYTVNYCTDFRGQTDKGNLAGARKVSKRVGNLSNKLPRVRLTNP